MKLLHAALLNTAVHIEIIGQIYFQHNPTNVFDALGIEITKDWWEIPREELLVEDEQLGSGSFGVVKKAYLNMREEGNERTLCAVKMAKGIVILIIDDFFSK